MLGYVVDGSHCQALFITGVFGGRDGRRAKLIRNYGRPDHEELYSKVARVEMKVGDSMRIETPGAGGYGAPAERALESIAADVRNGKVSRAAAERDYGVERVRAALKADTGLSKTEIE